MTVDDYKLVVWAVRAGRLKFSDTEAMVFNPAGKRPVVYRVDFREDDYELSPKLIDRLKICYFEDTRRCWRPSTEPSKSTAVHAGHEHLVDAIASSFSSAASKMIMGQFGVHELCMMQAELYQKLANSRRCAPEQ